MTKRLTAEELDAAFEEIEGGLGLAEERDPYDTDRQAGAKVRNHIAALEAENAELRAKYIAALQDGEHLDWVRKGQP
jgi:hypothetical protein